MFVYPHSWIRWASKCDCLCTYDAVGEDMPLVVYVHTSIRVNSFVCVRLHGDMVEIEQRLSVRPRIDAAEN